MNTDLQSHWNKTYSKVDTQKLGWYEENPEPSLKIINGLNLNKNSAILNVGVGTSLLIDKLLDNGYTNIIANDLSNIALDILMNRVNDSENRVRWVQDDLLKPDNLLKIDKIDIWHDRAVLHFFNLESEKKTYFNLIRKLVKSNGFVIIAAFSLKSATKCCGLPVNRYDELMIQENLGLNFTLIESFNYIYTQPSGDTREYIYTVFKRN